MTLQVAIRGFIKCLSIKRWIIDKLPFSYFIIMLSTIKCSSLFTIYQMVVCLVYEFFKDVSTFSVSLRSPFPFTSLPLLYASILQSTLCIVFLVSFPWYLGGNYVIWYGCLSHLFSNWKEILKMITISFFLYFTEIIHNHTHTLWYFLA